MKLLNTLMFTLAISNSNVLLANTFKTEKWNTQSGVPVVFYQAMEVPMLDISIAFAAGSAYDGPQFGLSSLTTHLFNQGSSGENATQIADKLAEKGSQFNAENNRDMATFNLKTLTEKEALNQSVNTFSQIINHPDFTDEAFEREKRQSLMAIEQTHESPEDVALLNFFKTLYLNHPYAHPVNGTKETVNSINKNNVVDFYKKYFVSNNAILVMVGAIDSKAAHGLAEKITKDLPKGSSAELIPKASQFPQQKQIKISFPSSQTVIRLGQIGIDHQNQNYFSLLVGNYILGGGTLVSRLGTEVREKRGYTYGVNSQFVPMHGQGPFLISLSTQNAKTEDALKVTKDTLNSFIKEGPSEDELNAAKQYITGSFPLSLASNHDIATLLLRMNFYHLPDNYLDNYVTHINNVSAEEIKMAFKQTIDPDKLLLIRVGQS